MENKQELKQIKDEIWLAIPSITEEVNEYEYRGDSVDYTPTENERHLMEDFGHGFIEETVNKVAKLIYDTRAKQVDERMEFDVDAVEKMIVNSNHACCMYPKDLAQAIVNTFKPKVEKKSIKELQDKLVKFFSIESLTLNESTIVHLVAMISQHSYYADKPKVDQWISVEDRLPEKPEHAGQVITLLITDGNVVTTTRFTYTGVWESYGHLTHWQPLPEAPKINKEGTQNDNT